MLLTSVLHCAIALFIIKLSGMRGKNALWIAPLISLLASLVIICIIIPISGFDLGVLALLVVGVPVQLIVTLILSLFTATLAQPNKCNTPSLKTKKVSLLVLIVLILAAIAAVSFPIIVIIDRRPEPITTDYLEKYSDFLNYSLGDFTVVIDGELRPRPYPHRAEHRSWLLLYTRHDGELRGFIFDNSSSFDFAVVTEAQRIAATSVIQISDDFINLHDYLREYLHGSPSFHGHSPMRLESQLSHLHPVGIREVTWSFWSDEHHGHERITPLTGIRLSSITPAELVSDWGFVLSISVVSTDIDNRMDTVKTVDAMVRAFSEYFNQDQIEVTFRLSNSYFCFDSWERRTFDGFADDDFIDLFYVWLYDRQSDSFETLEVRDRGFLRIPQARYENLEIRVER